MRCSRKKCRFWKNLRSVLFVWIIHFSICSLLMVLTLFAYMFCKSKLCGVYHCKKADASNLNHSSEQREKWWHFLEYLWKRATTQYISVSFIRPSVRSFVYLILEFFFFFLSFLKWLEKKQIIISVMSLLLRLQNDWNTNNSWRRSKIWNRPQEG